MSNGRLQTIYMSGHLKIFARTMNLRIPYIARQENAKLAYF